MFFLSCDHVTLGFKLFLNMTPANVLWKHSGSKYETLLVKMPALGETNVTFDDQGFSMDNILG